MKTDAFWGLLSFIAHFNYGSGTRGVQTINSGLPLVYSILQKVKSEGQTTNTVVIR